jgi:hypothetical protein
MALLATGVETPTKRGLYILDVIIGTGTADVEISTDGQAFSPITDASFSASDQKQIQLPDCKIKATLTGDAVVTLNETVIAKG